MSRSTWLAVLVLVAGCDKDGAVQPDDTDTDTTPAGSTGLPSGTAETGRATAESFRGLTFCPAAGVLRGGGVQAVTCFGPSLSASSVSRGGGVVWIPGPFAAAPVENP